MAFPRDQQEWARRNEEQFQRDVARYDARWMSDTRWRKVLTAVAADPGDVRRCELRYIGRQGVVYESPVIRADLLCERGIKDHANLGGPSLFREIEWVRWPRKVREADGTVRTQDVERLREVILRAAKPMLVLDEAHLWLIAYSRQREVEGQRSPDGEYKVPMPNPSSRLPHMYDGKGKD